MAGTEVRSSRGAFEEVVQRASATGTELPVALIDNVRKQFDAIDQELAGVDEQDVEDCEAKLSAIVVRAEELERLRAYVMPRDPPAARRCSRWPSARRCRCSA
jgi:hypothetical protein